MSSDDLGEMFSVLGPVSIRRIFSGKGVYFHGFIIAIEYGDELRLKADPLSAPEFQAAGSTQWAYDGRRGPVLMPYWSVPVEAYDEPELMKRWLDLAFEAGLRAPATKPAPRRRRRPE